MPEIPPGYGPPVIVCSRTCDVVPLVTLGDQDWQTNCELCEADVLLDPAKWRAARDQWGCDPIIRCSPCARTFDHWAPKVGKRRKQLLRARGHRRN